MPHLKTNYEPIHSAHTVIKFVSSKFTWKLLHCFHARFCFNGHIFENWLGLSGWWSHQNTRTRVCKLNSRAFKSKLPSKHIGVLGCPKPVRPSPLTSSVIIIVPSSALDSITHLKLCGKKIIHALDFAFIICTSCYFTPYDNVFWRSFLVLFFFFWGGGEVEWAGGGNLERFVL